MNSEKLKKARDAFESIVHMCRHGGPGDDDGPYFREQIETVDEFFESLE